MMANMVTNASQTQNTMSGANNHLLRGLDHTRPSLSQMPALPTANLNQNQLEVGKLQNFGTSQVASGAKQSANLKSANLNKGLGIAGGVADIADSLIPEPDNVSGAGKALGIASKVAGILPGPFGTIAKLGLTGLNMFNKMAGGSANEQMTKNLAMTGYSTNINTQAGESFDFLGRKNKKRANAKTARNEEMNVNKALASRSAMKQTLAANLQGTMQRNATQTGGRLDYRSLVSKKGGKLLSIKQLIYKAKNGLKLPVKDDNSTNVIAGGALHARKNNMKAFKDDITHKGIPVISGDLTSEDGKIELKKDGEIKQDAEIEREEIIFRKQLTDKVEKEFEKYKSAEKKEKSVILINTGKLLVTEILENTIDNANILEDN